MAIIALKAWYLQEYEPLRDLEKRPHDLRLNKNSLLKSALRADFLDDSETVKHSAWFQRYLQGERVEFYIEGSGGYAIANIDLSSHEIYFIKQEVLAHLEPTIFFCYQTEYPVSSDLLRDELKQTIATLNHRARLPILLEESHRLTEGPLRLNSTLIRKMRLSLLLVADVTAIAQIPGTPPQLIPSPKVCVEVGYALESKRPEQILLLHQERAEMPGQFPFDLPSPNRFSFQTQADLHKALPQMISTQLRRYHLFIDA
ncbi:hypothetical protein DO97_14890 [Neosynechococcus sphagnicola sy1]|uniref:Uncharacterized protein n=1 Tax=Neosynechococcus sphagnicola sy1 TaxID=1497020 RepID=A0A098TI99_9CYAN|nr:hypothetical protein [Neosynechococcus sphagnicola]KGF71834.1 hypothetical protein DO97_14890 [Neosynechococcus sphagnicola sy1]